MVLCRSDAVMAVLRGGEVGLGEAANMLRIRL